MLFAVICTSCTSKKEKKDAEPKPPNIIVIFADDLGYGDIGCYGAKGIKTPNLDALATGGFRSTDFFIPANVCSPSRAALLTGRYPMRAGYPVATRPAFPKYKNYGFAPEELTIPELLKSAGYRSLMVGKWHLGMEVKGSHPLDAGFDEYLGIPSNYGVDNTLYHNKDTVAKEVSCEILTSAYTDKVVDFINENQDHPFFIYVSHHIVHNPLLPSEGFKGSSEYGEYGDFVQELDFSTGRIMKALEEAKLHDNTLMVFTSDNGPTYKGQTGGLSGGKYCTMEGGHRVPGIFYWPDEIPVGQTSSTLMSSMDLMPLFCNIAAVNLPKDRKIDGENILDILKGKTSESPHEFTYYYNGTNLQAIRKGKWKLHLPRTVSDQPFWSKTGHPKVDKGFITLEDYVLFNLEDDLAEKVNVVVKHPEVVALLKKQADIIRAELGDVHVIGTDQRVPNLKNPQERDPVELKK
ncbi:arylsulfatase [Flagellimonas eckloniae]|uniref:Arylsulfatase n=1 Tax=Flagellimonas eckloniae TaxID=346185 RepID=A0A0N8WGL4_9FLAO|nr:arylsulfatase [Allomuricauda eckloniae]